MVKSSQVKSSLIKILCLSSALCSTQAWAMDPGPADAAASGGTASRQLEQPLVPAAAVEAYKSKFLEIILSEIISSKDIFFLYNNVHLALKADPTQGPVIARALIQLFPEIFKKVPREFYNNVHIALKADPTQGPDIARALIQLFLPKNFSGWPYDLNYASGFIMHSILLNAIQKQKLARSDEVGTFLTWVEKMRASTIDLKINDSNITDLENLLAPIRARVLAREEQAVATDLSNNRGGKVPAEVACVIGEYVWGYDPSKHKSLQDIRDREKLQRYYAEEAAFLAANPGGDFKAAFAAKYPDMQDWLDDMIFAGHIR